KDRPGGYSRIIRIGTRAGDAAEMVYLELVDEEYVAQQLEERTPEPAAAAVEEAPVEEAEPEAEATDEPEAVTAEEEAEEPEAS
ncbi:MAG TPA: L17 family ribosomal protein, partial [Gaiellaceae bacterium]